jgi:hypothetical protein
MQCRRFYLRRHGVLGERHLCGHRGEESVRVRASLRAWRGQLTSARRDRVGAGASWSDIKARGEQFLPRCRYRHADEHKGVRFPRWPNADSSHGVPGPVGRARDFSGNPGVTCDQYAQAACRRPAAKFPPCAHDVLRQIVLGFFIQARIAGPESRSQRGVRRPSRIGARSI